MNPILIRSLRWAAVACGGLLLSLCFALACTFVYLAPSLPTAETMGRVQLEVPLRVYTRSGAFVMQFGEQRRIPVEFEDIPPLVRQAVLAAEDDRFFEHSGLDWMGVTRALLKTLSGDSSQGGSTISQQAARNMFLTLDRTLRRKASELFVTWRMERDFTKEQILATYLNVIFLGQRSYGMAAAAETYYGKRLEELSIGQAATLAGIIQSPSRQNPITSPETAAGRRAYVLRRMTELGYIDAAQAEQAAKEPIASRGFSPLIDVEAPYLAEMVRQEFIERFGEEALDAGYKVYTTLDDRLQTAANLALRVKLLEYDRRHGYRGRLGKVELPAVLEDVVLDALLADYPAVNLLEPAVVIQVGTTTADVYVRGRGKARIPWDGMSWAAKPLAGGGTGAAPQKSADVVRRGDVIHVVADGRGNAQLGQVPQAQASIVALDPVDGAIVSLVGGFDFNSNQFNRVTQAKRQPGSGFKPFLYSAALENGYTPASIINDMPVLLDQGLSEENWKPENHGGRFLGPMTLREALIRSRNLVSIRILQDIGVDALIRHADRFGFDTEAMPRNLTLALGSLTTSPLQVAAGYAVFANGGFRVEPYFITRIEDALGKAVYEAEPVIACVECEQAGAGPVASMEAPGDPAAAPADAGPGNEEAATAGGLTRPGEGPGGFEASGPGIGSPVVHPLLVEAQREAALSFTAAAAPKGVNDAPAWARELVSVQGGPGYLPATRLAPRVLSAQNAWLMDDIMHDVTVRGTAARTRRVLGRDDLHGKTGTTNDGRDNWFNGFTRQLVASVWVGYDDYSSLGDREEGSTTAVPIWIQFMQEALKGVPESRLERPGGLVDLKVSPRTGNLADARDPTAVVETFMVDKLPPPPRPGEGGYYPDGPEGEPGEAGAERPRGPNPLF